MKYLLFCGIVIMNLLSIMTANAQGCKQFPADCPDYAKLQNEEDSIGYIKNLVLPQEITMIRRLRSTLTGMMEQIAKENKWEVYLLTESEPSGIGLDNVPLAYELRPPYNYSISFVFIVNQDSLLAWQNWYNNDFANASYKVVNAMKDAGSEINQDVAFNKNNDSANIYGTELSDYMTRHFPEYQKAISANDKRGIDKYERGLKLIQDKLNSAIARANGQKDAISSVSNKKQEDLHSMKSANMITYRDASMIRVKFNFNDRLFAATASETVNQVRNLEVPGTIVSILMHNDKPDENEIFDLDQFTRSPLFAILLLGKWQTGMDKDKLFHSEFSTNPKYFDRVTIKKIPSDKVQNIGIHVEGSVNNIRRFISVLNINELNKFIAKN